MTYKFGTTDLKFTLCLNREKDPNGIEKSECYVVQSLRDEDCFSKSTEAYEVTHIFSKRNDEKAYSDLLFLDRSANMDSLPQEIVGMLNEKLLPVTFAK
ncbi:MAG: hypothetical protein LUE90_08355 [Clostridiales bacterium]|nr:hypothetical protein [Clostridiales bacterium]